MIARSVTAVQMAPLAFVRSSTAQSWQHSLHSETHILHVHAEGDGLRWENNNGFAFECVLLNSIGL